MKCVRCLLLFFCAYPSLIPLATAQTLTSSPSGAKVEIDGVAVGTTPYEVKLPGGYFHKTHTVFNARLEHAMILRVSLDGYTSKEITMTEGPMQWQTLNGVNHGNYWLLKTDHFNVELEPLCKSFTGTVVATAAGNSKVEMRFTGRAPASHCLGFSCMLAFSACPRCAQSLCCSGEIWVDVSPAGTELHRIVSSNPGAEKMKVRLIGSLPMFFAYIHVLAGINTSPPAWRSRS